MTNQKKTQKFTPVGELGEFGLIERLTGSLTRKHPSTKQGPGDDAAVIRYGKDACTLVSTDMLVEGVHFNLIYTPLVHLGYKAVVANLSDIYAMNATPRQITVSLALSSKFPVEAIEALYEGIKAACKRYEVDLVGGDTTASLKGLVISITAIGEAAEQDIVYRSGAKAGDVICVSGDLGGAYMGLLLLEREKEVFQENPDIQPKLKGQDYIVGRFLKPEARADIIQVFRDLKLRPTAMIDVSDGVSSDIMHICRRSKTGCVLEEEQFPIDRATYHKALDFNHDPTTCFLNGGEDYELLFTLRPDDYKKVAHNPDITRIGEIKPAKDGCKLLTKSDNWYELKAQGWDGVKK